MSNDEEPKGSRPTLKTIAFMTGLGVSTVSQALKNAPDISRATKERVQLVAKQIGYTPNRAGVRLRTGKTHVIALVLNTKEEGMGLVSELVYGVSEALSDTPYHLVVTPYALSDPMSPIRYIVETSSADGVIISRTQPDDPRVRYLIENNMPFATHGRTEMDVVHPYHDFDNHDFAYEAVRILADKGRKNIALLGPPPGLSYQKHTRSGFDHALKDFGLSEFSLGDLNLDSDTAAIISAGEELARAKNRPDGVVCCAAGLAITFSSGLMQGGSIIGQDIDIVGKETNHLLDLLQPEIFYIHENLRVAGRDLAVAVLAWIGGADPSTLQFLTKPSRRSS